MDRKTIERLSAKLESSGVRIARSDYDPKFVGKRVIREEIPWHAMLVHLISMGYTIVETVDASPPPHRLLSIEK